MPALALALLALALPSPGPTATAGGDLSAPGPRSTAPARGDLPPSPLGLAAPPGAHHEDRPTLAASHPVAATGLLAATYSVAATSGPHPPTKRLALAPTRPAADPPPPLLAPPPADPRAAAARAAYAAGDYIGAARQYEALTRDTGAPRYLFNAGMAREAAGELSHATLQWRRYLSSGTATAEDRELLGRKLTAAAASLISLQLRPEPGITSVALLRGGDHDPIEVTPDELADPVTLEAGTWTARIYGAGEPLEVRIAVAPDAAPVVLPAPKPHVEPPPLPPIETGTLTVQVGPPRALRRGVTLALQRGQETRNHDLRSASATWDLPRGAWTVSASAPDRTTAQQTVTVAELPQRLELSLRLTPAVRGHRIIAPAILGATGLGLVVGGAAFAARASQRSFDCVDQATCEATANNVLDVSTGFALVGTGVGTIIPAATAAAGARSRALAIEAGIGGAIFAGGLTWYLAEAIGTTALDHRPREHTAATMLGVGAGMVSSAVLMLLVRRALRDRRAATQSHTRHHVSF